MKYVKGGKYKGICPTCGKEWQSCKNNKVYCSLECYKSDPQLKEKLIKKLRDGLVKTHGENCFDKIETICLNCQKTFLQKKTRYKKYCGAICYRQYMAKRFDRWIASPQEIALPQNYDEFMTQEELPCLVKGCDWVGHHLGTHVNLAHGIPVEEFKKMCGFNLGTGLVSPETHKNLCDRENIGIALMQYAGKVGNATGRNREYKSLEGREHASKSIALNGEIRNVTRTCKFCKNTYETPSIGHFKFCGIDCREKFYKQKELDIKVEIACDHCGKMFHGRYGQRQRKLKGETVFCSVECRNTHNSRLRVLNLKRKEE